MKMVETLAQTAAKYPKYYAYDFMGCKKTYGAFMTQIDAAARALLALGVKQNDIIGIVMPNMPQALVFFYAANKIGAAVNMIHPLSGENELAQFINRVHCKTVLILDQFYPKLAAVRAKTALAHVIVTGAEDALSPIKGLGYKITAGRKIHKPRQENGILSWHAFMTMGKGNVPVPTAPEQTDKPAVLLHSGGTTGKIKCVCLSDANVHASCTQMTEGNPMIASGDRFLTIMPIFHGNGLFIGVHSVLMIGACCVLIPRFTPESYARDLIKNKCNYLSGVPVLYERLMQTKTLKKADLSFLKCVFCGADYLSVDLEQRINEFLVAHHSPVCVRQGYGMTEGVVASLMVPADAPRLGSIGKPLPHVLAKIVDPETNADLPIGETGEIVFSSDTNMLGYYEDPDETALVKRQREDGREWIHSGDLGCMDADGYFYFKGRSKRMIVVNGYNVFPNEMETVLAGFPMVANACVVGVPYTEGTECVRACIVLKPDVPATEQTKQEILNLCRKNIAKYALPREIVFIDKLPTTKIGKVDYQQLRQ